MLNINEFEKIDKRAENLIQNYMIYLEERIDNKLHKMNEDILNNRVVLCEDEKFRDSDKLSSLSTYCGGCVVYTLGNPLVIVDINDNNAESKLYSAFSEDYFINNICINPNFGLILGSLRSKCSELANKYVENGFMVDFDSSQFEFNLHYESFI